MIGTCVLFVLASLLVFLYVLEVLSFSRFHLEGLNCSFLHIFEYFYFYLGFEMSSLEITHLDLECGVHRGSSAVNNEEEEASICFPEVEESSYSQFYSTADESNDYEFDHKTGQVFNSTRVSSMAESQCWVENKNEVLESKVHSEKVERDCRICQLSLDMDESDQESGVPIELGCSCKDDLAAAHKHCAEAWFKIKGNK